MIVIQKKPDPWSLSWDDSPHYTDCPIILNSVPILLTLHGWDLRSGIGESTSNF
jgi:hypothetical protein